MHVALILDGNRRWATDKGLPKMEGHKKGAENLKPIIKKAKQLGIQYITLYVLSTENQKNRSPEELAYLYKLFTKITDFITDFKENDVRLNAIGDIDNLPLPVRKALAHIIDTTKDGKSVLTLALNYGGRNEITRAVNKAIKQGKAVTEDSFNALLDTKDLPDVDLVIRTGGHHRLSNYLPWQATYAELYFTETYWPDFSPERFQEAYDWFTQQKRNGGK